MSKSVPISEDSKSVSWIIPSDLEEAKGTCREHLRGVALGAALGYVIIGCVYWFLPSIRETVAYIALSFAMIVLLFAGMGVLPWLAARWFPGRVKVDHRGIAFLFDRILWKSVVSVVLDITEPNKVRFRVTPRRGRAVNLRVPPDLDRTQLQALIDRYFSHEPS